jgi:hypothetical protein
MRDDLLNVEGVDREVGADQPTSGGRLGRTNR